MQDTNSAKFGEGSLVLFDFNFDGRTTKFRGGCEGLIVGTMTVRRSDRFVREWRKIVKENSRGGSVEIIGAVLWNW